MGPHVLTPIEEPAASCATRSARCVQRRFEQSLVILCISLMVCCALQTAHANSSSTQQISLQALAKLPPLSSMSLSPNGHQAVALAAFKGTYHAVLFDFKNGTSKLLMASDPENFLFNWCRFANDTRIVCSIRSYIVLKAGNIGVGSRYYRDGRTIATRLLAVDTDGQNVLQLIPKAQTRARGNLVWNAPDQDDVISWLPEDPKHILVQVARDNRVYPSVYKLNIYTNRLKRTQKYLESVARWFADDKGEIRFAIGRHKGGEPGAYFINKGKRTRLDISHLIGLDTPKILAFAPDNQSVFLIANHAGADTQGLHRVELSTGKVLETLFEHPTYDAARYKSHPPTKQILYVGYDEEDEHLIWFNKELETALQTVREKIGRPKYLNLWSATPDLSHFILAVEGNGVSPTIYRYANANRSLMKLGQVQQGPHVDFEYVTYTARDGLKIPAYLALPGPKEKGPYPTIVDPHGGPWSEDRGRYFFWNQYFLSRGYAVLKPNFRGSTGYGDAYTAAGFEQWGGKMQDDLIDGLDWMIQQGLADPTKTCIHGGSYGGYAALVAAYKTPGKFQCAISFAGVTDLAGLRDRWYNFLFGRLSSARLPTGDQLKANSPIENVQAIKLPLLLVHGDVDRSVMIEQSREFVKTLQKHTIPHRYIEQTNGDHFLSLEKHRLEYLMAVDDFLVKHLGRETTNSD